MGKLLFCLEMTSSVSEDDSHTIEYHLECKKEQLWIHAMTQMDPKGIMMHEKEKPILKGHKPHNPIHTTVSK